MKKSKSWITAEDLKKGSKRINLTIETILCSKIAKVSLNKALPPATLLKMYVVEAINKDYEKLPGEELPGQQNMFDQRMKKNEKKSKSSL
jgi:hypothetical protein